jgi:ABC-type thiamin/hydroxymethylpyrimidine transport system permease subunit
MTIDQREFKFQQLLRSQPDVTDGFTSTSQFMAKNTIFGILTLRDLLIAAILGVMGGFISSLIPFSLPIKMFYPFMGGTQLVSGHHTIWMAIAFGLSRKKAAPLVTAFIKGILEALLGDNWGAFIIVINLLEAAALIVGFWLIERFNERDTKFGWAIAGGLGNFVQAPIFWVLTGRIFVIHYSLAILSFIFAFLSGCLITGLLGRQIVKLIEKSEGET